MLPAIEINGKTDWFSSFKSERLLGADVNFVENWFDVSLVQMLHLNCVRISKGKCLIGRRHIEPGLVYETV